MTLLRSQVEWHKKDDKEKKKCPPHRKVRKGEEKSKLNPPRCKYLDALLGSSGVHFKETLRMKTLMMIPTQGWWLNFMANDFETSTPMIVSPAASAAVVDDDNIEDACSICLEPFNSDDPPAVCYLYV
ncbi:hypothetical protein CQW23_02265 [Capsicum baccatum]|uniref:Uncharacterized protein n=1 Tax=Capsicum baccatum TaxID=33114 RepID=A0A2G2XQZ4_CAPBA|nr:hypothetical protein CQW23_02265 [Capsicum baccatum]